MDVASVRHKLGQLVDRLSYEGLDDTDTVNTAHAIRRVARGQKPSDLLLHFDQRRDQARTITDLKRRVNALVAEKQQLEDEKRALVERLVVLEVEQARAEAVRARNSVPERETYTYKEVIAIIVEKFGKQNGGLTAWAEESARLHNLDPNSPVVTTGKLQQFRMADNFPEWAVDQLRNMEPVRRQFYRWSEEDISFLERLHLDDPLRPDEELAKACSERFGAEINTASIKGKFRVLRKLGRIPMYRPHRAK